MKKTWKTLVSLSLLAVAACSSTGSSNAAPAVNAGGSCCSAEGKGGSCCAEGKGEACAPTAAPAKKN